MKIITWSVVNNEIDFIEEIIKYHTPWVDCMFFLDTGSTDGTLEVLQKYAKNNCLLFKETDKKYISQYDQEWHEMSNPFPEVEIRNQALDYLNQNFEETDW